MSSRVNKDHLKALQGSGETAKLTINLDKELRKKFNLKTKSEETTMTEIIIGYIKEYIKRN